MASFEYVIARRLLRLSAGLVIGLVMGCGSGKSADDGTFEVALQSDQATTLGASSKASITLWAYDGTIADQAATRLDSVSASVSQIPATVKMQIPQDAAQRVDPNSGANARICYYVTLVVDVDGDGQICEGDLRVDFDRTAQVQTCSIDAMEKEFFLKAVPAGSGCNPVTRY